jgi:hypothetical protein
VSVEVMKMDDIRLLHHLHVWYFKGGEVKEILGRKMLIQEIPHGILLIGSGHRYNKFPCQRIIIIIDPPGQHPAMITPLMEFLNKRVRNFFGTASRICSVNGDNAFHSVRMP